MLTNFLFQGGKVTVYYNPRNRFDTTVEKGVASPMTNALFFLFGIAIFFIPLLPARRIPLPAFGKTLTSMMRSGQTPANG